MYSLTTCTTCTTYAQHSPAGEGSIENKPDVNTPACRRRRLNGGIWGRTRGPTSRNILPKTNMAPVGERRLWRMLGRESNIGLDVCLFGAIPAFGQSTDNKSTWPTNMGMRDELRRSGESCGKMEAVWGEFGAIGPAFGQRTDDDDDLCHCWLQLINFISNELN